MAANRFPVIRGPDAQQSRVQDNIQGVLAPVARALQNTPVMGAPPPAWILVSVLNGFDSPAQAQFDSFAFHKDCLGYVHIKGSAIHAAGTAAFTTLFILPKGYRTLKTRIFAASASGGAVQQAFLTNAGEVQNRVAMAAGSSIYLEFSFLAEA